MYTVEIPDELWKPLVDLAAQKNCSVRTCVEEALVRLLENEEDYLLAIQALEEGGPYIPWEQAKKQLGLDNENPEN